LTKIFLDTASANEIREFLSWGVGDGVTTNQKIFLAEGNVDFKERILEICEMKQEWPVSVETTTKDFDELVAEAEEYSGWHRNIVVKVAMDKDGVGLKVVKKLYDEGVKTNMTVMVTFNQLYLAAKAGATYVSLFFNRAKDAGLDPVKTIHEIVPVLERDTESRLICGSIRKPEDVEEIVTAGAHIATITPKVLLQMPFHQKTEETIKEFDDAWAEFVAKNNLVLPIRQSPPVTA
jgi:transaldolase